MDDFSEFKMKHILNIIALSLLFVVYRHTT